MEYPAINALAEKFNATSAQILLSWGVQRGTSVIPKSENAERMAKNLQVRRTSLQRNCTLWIFLTEHLLRLRRQTVALSSKCGECDQNIVSLHTSVQFTLPAFKTLKSPGEDDSDPPFPDLLHSSGPAPLHGSL